jgi:hypothetical protein
MYRLGHHMVHISSTSIQEIEGESPEYLAWLETRFRPVQPRTLDEYSGYLVSLSTLVKQCYSSTLEIRTGPARRSALCFVEHTEIL